MVRDSCQTKVTGGVSGHVLFSASRNAAHRPERPKENCTNPDKSLHNIRLADIGAVADDNVERMTVFEELNRWKKSGLKDLNSNVGVLNS